MGWGIIAHSSTYFTGKKDIDLTIIPVYKEIQHEFKARPFLLGIQEQSGGGQLGVGGSGEGQGWE